MIIARDNERLYLTSWQYNSALIFDALAKVIENNGGSVKPEYNKAIISNRSLDEAMTEYKDRVAQLEYIVNAGKANEKTLDALAEYKAKLEEYASINNDPVTVKRLSYISFTLDGMYYYFQTDDNPFFEFYYQKTPVRNGKRSKDAYLMEFTKDWLYDCFFRVGCANADIAEAANLIFNALVNAPISGIHRDGKKTRVPNTYNNGYHYETVYAPERFETVEF